jgi:hypothetical protein
MTPRSRTRQRERLWRAPGLLLLLLLCVTSRTVTAQRAPPPGVDAARALLSQAIDLYVVGRYREAAERLRPLVETRVLTDRADQGEALRAYGISLYLSGGHAGAARAFRDLLRLEPTTRLDPAFVRPEVVSYFEAVRRQVQGELNELVRKRGPKHSAAVNLLPPWGQFRNGHRTKGYVVLAGELVFGLTSITTAALLYAWRGDTRVFAGHEDVAGPLTKMNYVSFAAVAALVVYGIIDGLYYYYNPPPASPPDMRSATPSPYAPRTDALFRF